MKNWSVQARLGLFLLAIVVLSIPAFTLLIGWPAKFTGNPSPLDRVKKNLPSGVTKIREERVPVDMDARYFLRASASPAQFQLLLKKAEIVNFTVWDKNVNPPPYPRSPQWFREPLPEMRIYYFPLASNVGQVYYLEGEIFARGPW